MKYINTFKTHASYESELNGGVGINLPNVSYCEDVKDVHYNPYNTVEFYVGEITPPQTVKIYTDSSTSVDVQVSEGNKWYTYVLPKDKGLYTIESGYYDDEDSTWNGGIVTKVTVKANINYNYDGNNDKYNGIVPWEITEASFKGSNTSKLTNMNRMFQICNGLTSLDLSGWNTSNVTDMYGMFFGCIGLTSLDVSNFNTSNVTDMYGMFYGCIGLTSLDLSGWNTSNVSDMGSMFNYCSGLTSLDLRNFNTSKVTDMGSMFEGCRGLTSLDLSGWDTSNVEDMSGMFDDCSKLSTIRMKGCSEGTINKITAVKPSTATIVTE